MPSQVDIANYALDLVGEESITDIDEGTKVSRLCKRNLDLCRDELIRQFPWKNFIARAQLAPDTTAPEWGYTTRHLLPGECLRIIDVYAGDDSYMSPVREWHLEGQYILSYETGTLNIRYMKRSVDYVHYDPTFVAALAARIAMNICEPITNSASKLQMLTENYRRAMSQAKQASAIESAVTPVNSPSSLEVARLGGFNGIGFR